MLVLATALAGQAQTSDYKVVFDFTSHDSVNQQTVVREIGLIRGANPGASLELVIYGQGLDLVIKGHSSQQAELQRLINSKAASVKVCAMSMKRLGIARDQLLPGVEVVPDGIYEIFSRPRAGWGYIKVAH